jgi:FlaA1/EpsC-like NDP-sugar epimerase
MISYLLEAPRPVKRLISLCYDALAIPVSFLLAYSLRLGTLDLPLTQEALWSVLATVAISIAVFIRIGLYRAVLRLMAHQAISIVMVGVVVSTIALIATSFYFRTNIPRSVPLIFMFTSLFFIGLPRALIRNIVSLMLMPGHQKVLIFGAQRHACQLASSLQQNGQYSAVAFIDNDEKLHGTFIKGLPVYGQHDIADLIKEHDIQVILLALDRPSQAQRVAVIRHLEQFSVQVQTIPPIEDLITGRAQIEELREISIEDLLGRESVAPIPNLMQANIENKVVFVSGAGGSIGSELCRQIIKQKPASLILLEQNEFNLYKIEGELKTINTEQDGVCDLYPILGSTLDSMLLKSLLSLHKVDTVYHTAAYKHVPMVERNIIPAVRNNILATQMIAEFAAESNVDTFVLISTDKAVRPTNIMGATKRLAELVIQSHALNYPNTKFSIVRFGNVLGSSGSVVPLFKQQIQQGGPVTVTHPEVTRYFMTASEAAQLVIQAGAMEGSGSVFVLEMGKPVKIFDLAHEMIHLSGLQLNSENTPHGDIAIEFTGLRPGEKLYEELLIGENCLGTQHPRIMKAQESASDINAIRSILVSLEKACLALNSAQALKTIAEAPVDYRSETLEPLEKTAEIMTLIKG